MRFAKLLMWLFIITTPILAVKSFSQQEEKQKFQQAGIETALIITAVAVSSGVAVYQQQQAQKSAEKEGKKNRALAQAQMAEQQQLQLQAGEYWEDLELKQMVLQQSENRFKTLADLLIMKTKQQKEHGQEILTTPPVAAATKEPSVIEKINQSIDKILRG